MKHQVIFPIIFFIFCISCKPKPQETSRPVSSEYSNSDTVESQDALDIFQPQKGDMFDREILWNIMYPEILDGVFPWNGNQYPAATWDMNAPDIHLALASVDIEELDVLGGYYESRDSAVIIMNRHHIFSGLYEVHTFLEDCGYDSLSHINEIDLCNAVLKQEYSHYLNHHIESEKQEYMSEVASFDCSAGEFYIAMRFIHVSENVETSGIYESTWMKYREIFELDRSLSYEESVDHFKELMKKKTFRDLIYEFTSDEERPSNPALIGEGVAFL